jgi:hypothetical protein
MSLNMLIEFGDALDYSGADFRKWCREVGFERVEVIHLAGPSSAPIAYKSSDLPVALGRRMNSLDGCCAACELDLFGLGQGHPFV